MLSRRMFYKCFIRSSYMDGHNYLHKETTFLPCDRQNIDARYRESVQANTTCHLFLFFSRNKLIDNKRDIYVHTYIYTYRPSRANEMYMYICIYAFIVHIYLTCIYIHIHACRRHVRMNVHIHALTLTRAYIYLHVHVRIRTFLAHKMPCFFFIL